MRLVGRQGGTAFCLGMIAARMLAGQESAPAAPDAQASAWGTKTIELKYLDPEQLRDVFSGQSYVMRANRELRLLTVSGPAAFLQQVEETGKRLDVPPPATADVEITVYLLATAAQAPAARALPPELAAVGKSLEGGAKTPALRLVDTQVVRVREGQAGEIGFGDPSATSPMLTRIRIQSAMRSVDPKQNVISLNGVRCWFNRPTPPGPTPAPGKSEGDVTANLDVVPQQAAVVASTGIEKPLAIVLRATIAR